MTEHDEQVALFQWCAYQLNLGNYPELAYLYAIPNGGARPARINPRTGARYSPEAQRLIDEGVKSGLPDMHLPLARHSYHSLYIELKTLTGRLSREQRVWIVALEAAGNQVAVCRGWEAARDVLLAYLT